MESLKILILDDEKNITDKLCRYLRSKNHDAFEAYNSGDAWQVLGEYNIDIAVIDVVLPDENGLNFVNIMSEKYPDIEVVIMSGHGTMDMVIDAMHKGAVDFVKKPFGFYEIQSAIERTNIYMEMQNRLEKAESQSSLISRELEKKINKVFIGRSEKIKNVIKMAMQIGNDRDANVLITGENGTGKEIIARIIHHSSLRRNRSIFTVNCSAIPDTLLESEFFGHRKGAFTDARENKKGYFELANGGSLFLDEIADMPMSLQAKLLRVLEEHKIRQIGGDKEVSIDVRIISATNKNIDKLISEQKFRVDLLHRINTFPIDIPPLRERPEDIEPLVKHFIKYFAQKKNKKVPRIDKKTISVLQKYRFPGNIRELRNMVERAIILAKDNVLNLADFTTVFDNNNIHNEKNDLNMDNQELNLIQKALLATKYNQNQAAHLLGISRDALIRRMKKYNIKITKKPDQ